MSCIHCDKFTNSLKLGSAFFACENVCMYVRLILRLFLQNFTAFYIKFYGFLCGYANKFPKNVCMYDVRPADFTASIEKFYG